MKLNQRFLIALALVVSLFGARRVASQETMRAGDLYAGYGFLSNSFNNYGQFSGTPMNGWDLGLTLYSNRKLSISFEALGLYGANLGASQFEHSILVGPEWSRRVGKESLFAHGLVGIGFINSGAIPFDHSSPSSNATFAALPGGGIDTPLSQHLAWRLEGDYLRSQFGSKSNQIHNLPANFAHVTTGVVIRF